MVGEQPEERHLTIELNRSVGLRFRQRPQAVEAAAFCGRLDRRR
jgi:hypothetical protein